MDLTYAEVTALLGADVGAPAHAEHSIDRPVDLPLLGFLVASVISVPLWGLIAWAAWTFLG